MGSAGSVLHPTLQSSEQPDKSNMGASELYKGAQNTTKQQPLNSHSRKKPASPRAHPIT